MLNLYKILNKIKSNILLLNMNWHPLTYLSISNFKLKWRHGISDQDF